MLRRFAIAVGLLAACAAAYAFRWRTRDHAHWGSVRQIWRWGRAAEMRMDRNRDGRPDLRLTYERVSTTFDNNPPDAYWEDRDFDGRYDLHAVYGGQQVQTIRLDENRDGVFERTLQGDAARQYRQQHPLSTFPHAPKSSLGLVRPDGFVYFAGLRFSLHSNNCSTGGRACVS
jgi:hypothetical protein